MMQALQSNSITSEQAKNYEPVFRSFHEYVESLKTNKDLSKYRPKYERLSKSLSDL